MTRTRVRLVKIGSLDLAVVSALHSKCFDEEPWDERAMAGIMAMPGSFGYIALKQDVPAGFVIARVVAGECEIISLGVCPDLRREGLGRTLLRAVLDQVAGSQADMTYLEVAEDNTAARQLYGRQGFTEVGRRRGYYTRGTGQAVAALVLRRLSN